MLVTGQMIVFVVGASDSKARFFLMLPWKMLLPIDLYIDSSPRYLFSLSVKLMSVYKYSQVYSEPSQTSKMNIFPKIADGYQPFTVFQKASS